MVIALSPLRMKLVRDLLRLWPQVMAMALVMAAGVATLILGMGAYTSLDRTRTAYYDSNRFADVFATVTRAPRSLGADIARIDGVLDVELRIARMAILDLPDMDEPGTAMAISLPSFGGLNQLYLRYGRFPEPSAKSEAVVSEGFAKAHGFQPGSRFAVLMNGQRRVLTITGTVLSPEYIYALGPGDMMPDDRRFGIVWMAEESLAAAYDQQGAFSSVLVKLAPGASEAAVIKQLDTLLARYGGVGAVLRKDQISHAFLDAELNQLRAMSRVLPPIFLIVAAFLVNMTLNRLVTLEREQIGLLKAIGYGRLAIALHYIEFVIVIALVGTLIGAIAGTWLGAGLAQMYARFFSFPFLVFSRSFDIYIIAALVTVLAAVLGAVHAVNTAVRLPPAVAMSPPAPPHYRRVFGLGVDLGRVASQSMVMVSRHFLRWPVRSASSVLGVAFAVAILVGSLWSFESVDRMIDISFARAERQDATLGFVGARPLSALYAVRHLTGVVAAEPFRAVLVRIGHAQISRQVVLSGRPAEADLSRVLGIDEKMMTLPPTGVVLSEALAAILKVGIGDTVEIAELEGQRERRFVTVSGISLGYLGLNAFMRLDQVNRLLKEGAMITGAQVSLDPTLKAAFYRQVKSTPQIGSVALLTVSVQRFRETLAQNLWIMVTVYTSLASIIAAGVVYNSVRISLSEQGRELASLRVLGFTRAEVAGLLFGELAVVVLLAQPLGWIIGYGFAVAMAKDFSSELYRVPLVVGPSVFATASLVVIGAAVASSLLVRRRINRLDLVEVLKTRE